MLPVQSPQWRKLAASVVVAVTFLLGATGLALRDTREAVEGRAVESLGNLSMSLERDITRSLETYDALLHDVADGIQPVAGTLGIGAKRRLLSDQFTDDLFGVIVVTDAQGRVVETSRPMVPDADVASRRYFTAHRDNAGLGLVVGEVARGNSTGRLLVRLSRRLASPDGHFRGVAVGSVKLDYFQRAFGNFQLGPGGAIALLSIDGRLLGSGQTGTTNVGRDLSGSEVMRQLLTNGPGVFEAKSIFDGRSRIYVGKRLGQLPFYLVVGTSKDGIFAEWRWRCAATAASVFGSLALLAMVADALRRELRRRTKAEAEAKASADELGLIAETIEDIILKFDWQGTRHFVSAACERLLGYTPGELVAGKASGLLHPDDQAMFAAALVRVREDKDFRWHLEYRLRHKNGTWRNFESRGRPLPDGSGLILVSRDVTERTEMQQQLAQAQRMEVVGQLTAGVAHDFNNLLQAQIGSLELVLDRVANQPETTRLVGMALAASERGAKLTHSLLAFSRKQVLRPATIEVAPLLASLNDMLGRTLDPRINVEIDVDASLTPALADAGQLETALINLCLNARDAMAQSGGRLLIEAYNEPPTSSASNACDGQRWVVIAVTDDGIGMDAATLGHAREPFFTTKEVGKGTGLGLSMVDGFARQSGGEMRIASALGKGTRVEIWLPQGGPRPTPLVAVVSARPMHKPALKPRRLLLVDDDPGVLNTVREMLECEGCDVVCAGDGETALRRLDNDGPFDLMVTDYAMRGITGGELVRAARLLDPDLPALIITGFAESAQLRQIPADIGVLHKPFRFEELASRIDPLVATRRRGSGTTYAAHKTLRDHDERGASIAALLL